jgi:hypothetical protein
MRERSTGEKHELQICVLYRHGLPFGFVHVGGKKAAKDHAAVWVPDSEAPVCMVCTKTKFSAITRRVWRAVSIL